MIDKTSQEWVDTIDKLDHFWRWIERAYFDDDLSIRECLSILVHSPYAPWNFDREKWDTSHKEYDAEIDAVVQSTKDMAQTLADLLAYIEQCEWASERLDTGTVKRKVHSLYKGVKR